MNKQLKVLQTSGMEAMKRVCVWVCGVLGVGAAWAQVDPRVREFVAPTRIVWTTNGVTTAEDLLKPRFGQVSEGVFLQGSGAMLPPGGALVLDFGRELHGSLQLGSGGRSGQKAALRIRFGESVAEAMAELGERGACNDHAIRDDVVKLPWFGSREIGPSGFRFVRLDNVTKENIQIEYARAISLMRPMARQGDFRCSDPRITAIWETAVRTAHLCSQDYLWDGIKRDRLVWVGDLNPEFATITSVFGFDPVLVDSLEYMAATTPKGRWMNGSFATYTAWFVRNVRDLWFATGDLSFAQKHRQYLKDTTEQLMACVKPDGTCNLPVTFLDWPTRHNSAAERAGSQALVLMALKDAIELANALDEPAWAAACRDTVSRMALCQDKGALDPAGSKQAAALLALSARRDAKAMFRDVLGKNGTRGVSTFYGFYMLEAMSCAGENAYALGTIRDYWGAMLDMGATSFWEDFKVSWTNNAFRIDQLPVPGKKDVHGDYGEFCYTGFRHSLCHGWSSGPAAWLIRHVLGLRFAEPGGRVVLFEPDLCGLDWAEGAIATPQGPVKVRVEKGADGALVKKVLSKPEGVSVK